MNILQILPELVVGGVETGTIDLCKELKASGHNVTVVSNGGPMVRQLEKIAVRHIKLPVHKKSLICILRCAKELEAVLRQEKADIVHARSRVPAIIAAIATRRIVSGILSGHLPVLITTCHGFYSSHLFSRPMGWGRYVIVSSNIIARHMMDDFGVSFDRIRYIQRGVDLAKFRFTPPAQRQDTGYKTIAVIGRITPIKGHEFFIRAAARVVNIIPGVKILIVGQPPEGKEDYKKNIEKLALKLGISEAVEFSGYKEDIPGVLSKTDLLVTPSVGPEAFGRVIIEAQAAGVPVVAAKVGGITDIITDRKNGLLVEPWDVKQLADAMIEVLKDGQLAHGLAQNAIQQVNDKFTLSVMAEKTIAVYQEALDKAKILVIKIGAIGDVVLVVPSLRAIRNRFPKAYIAVLVGIDAYTVLKNCPYLDEVIIYNSPFIKNNIFNFLKLAGDLRKANFDIVIDFQNNRRSHLLSFLSLAPKRLGYKNKKFGFLLNWGLDDSKTGLPPVKHQFHMLSLLRISGQDEGLELWPSGNDYKYADDFLNQQWLAPNQPLVGINIGASARWATKRWPREKITGLCNELARKYSAKVLLTGARPDAVFAKDIAASVKLKPIDAAGRTTLPQLGALISRCKAFITQDSAPMHIAAAVGVPLVAVFGPTDPARHAPPAEKLVVIRQNLKCSPCYKTKCEGFECINSLDINRIVEAIGRFL